MRNPQGYVTIVEPGQQTKEIDTFTCGHCNTIVHVQPLAKPEDVGGLCKICNKLICSPCVDLLKCLPWEKQLERMEARDRFLRSAGL